MCTLKGKTLWLLKNKCHFFQTFYTNKKLAMFPRQTETCRWDAFERPSGHAASSAHQDHWKSAFNSNSRYANWSLKLHFCSRFVSLQLSQSAWQSIQSFGCFNLAKISLLCRLIFIIHECLSVFYHPCNWKIVQICLEWGLLVLASDFMPKSEQKRKEIISENPKTVTTSNVWYRKAKWLVYVHLYTFCSSIFWVAQLSLRYM